MPEQPLLTGCLGIQFFYSPPFPTQSIRLPLVTYPSLCSTFVTYRTPGHAIGHQVLPTQPLPRGAEDFPRGDNANQLFNNLKLIFNHVKIKNVLLVVKILTKITATLISTVISSCKSTVIQK